MKIRLDGLDALRGFAALAVIGAHIGGALPTAWMQHATLAVPVFFGLSAFSLAYTYGPQLSLADYAKKRILRIVPLFYFMTAVWLVINSASGKPFPSLEAMLLNASFLFSYSTTHFKSLVPAGWSIGIEMSFYLVLPILLATITSIPRAVALSVLSLIAGYAYHEYLFMVGTTSYYHRANIPVSAVYFALGLLAYRIFVEVTPRLDETGRRRVSSWLLAGAGAVWIGAYCVSGAFGSFERSFAWRFLCALPTFAVLLAMAWHRWPLLTNRLTVYLGAISYSIYLTQFAVIRALRPALDQILATKHPITGATAYLVVALATVAVSSLTYRFVERPFTRLRRSPVASNTTALPGRF